MEARDTAGWVSRAVIVFEVRMEPVPTRSAAWGEIKAMFGDG